MNAWRHVPSLVGILLAIQQIPAELPSPVRGYADGVIHSTIDGDTLRVLVHGAVEVVKLADVDAPLNGRQRWGHAAEARLGVIAPGRAECRLNVKRRDTQGRIVADVWVNGVHVGRRMVEDGFAWASADCKDMEILRANITAAAKDRGLFGDPRGAVEPWKW